MPAIPIYQIDAFTDQLFKGNPAAVCPLRAWLDAGLMQRIASENNLSETAFFVPEGDYFRLRWFTPTVEVNFCGHATLASAYVFFSFLDKERERVVFETRRGRFTVEKSRGGALLMNLPAEPSAACEPLPELPQGLGAVPVETHSGPFLMAVFGSARDITGLKPDMPALAELCRKQGSEGVIATAPGEGGCDFVSRFFDPAHGIPEDPVTGSAHCMMAPYWAERLGKSTLAARQLSERGGAVKMRVQGERILMEGECRFYMKGEIALP